jgi:hypothetical protein
MGIVHSLGLWHGVLAFGFGLVLGSCLDAVPTPVPVAGTTDEVVVDRTDRTATDEPMTAEQADAAYNAEPKTVVVGPHDPE